MKSNRIIKNEIRAIRKLIDNNKLTDRGEDQAYGVECGLKWAIGEFNKRESTEILKTFPKEKTSDEIKELKARINFLENKNKMEYKYFGKKEKIGPCRIYIKIIYSNNVIINESLKHIYRHSPDGMQIGYAGSGPADTALSILTDYCKRTERDIKIADQYYQDFKFKFIAPIEGDLEIDGKDIEKYLKGKG